MPEITTAKPNKDYLTGIPRRLTLDGVLDPAIARKAISEAAQKRCSIEAHLLQEKLVTSTQMAAAKSIEFGMPIFDPEALDPEQSAINAVSEELIEKHSVLPLFKRGNRLFIGISDPANTHALDEIRFHTNLSIEAIFVDQKKIQQLSQQWLSANSLDLGTGDEGLENLEVQLGESDSANKEIDNNFDSKKSDAPIVKFINKILIDAIRRGASDIHFEPYERDYRIRLRVDGVLQQSATIPIKLQNRTAARLKVMSNLDIAEKRIPQDGRIKLNLSKNKQIDFRVSTLPTLFGEKIVLRILDASITKMGIEQLGYEPNQQELFVNTIHKPHGMVLVTGPTGSGKTVSLYTALGILNNDSRNISTVEDPVEIRLRGVNQVQMNSRRGMTFAAALRSFLRQDPDVIMVGEIRDLETAEIAIKAAQTGHMVLSTLHTNDAPQTIARLMNMGVAPFNITSSIALVIAQRLARRLHKCKKLVKLPKQTLLDEGFEEQDVADDDLIIYGPGGCGQCAGGYKGRVGVYQVMPMTEEIQEVILSNAGAQKIAEIAKKNGVKDLRQSGLLKVKNGLTSLEEINRITTD